MHWEYSRAHCYRHALVASVLAFVCGPAQPSDALQPAAVREQLIGNFRYLMASQVDCAGSYESGSYICNKEVPGARRIQGSWDSYLIPLAIKTPYPVRFADSNLFFTVHTLLPLFSIRFEDTFLEQQRVDSIHAAMTAINLFRRGDGYAFWPQLGPTRSKQLNRGGPLNMSPLLLGTQIVLISRIQNFFHVNLFPSKVDWLENYLDLENEAIGMDVLFNVPNDTDDTALAIASNYYYYQERKDPERLEEYLQMSKNFAGHVDTFERRNSRRYKDYLEECEETWQAQTSNAARQSLFSDKTFLVDCSLDDTREHWRYDAYESKHSGAFLTWLYDENEPIYAHPEDGVVLPGQNSVDCYAIANVVYSLSLTGMRDDPLLREGYVSSCNAITNTILNERRQLWKSCGLFFPAHMTYPYLVSRAVGDGDACQDLQPDNQSRFDKAVGVLVDNIISEQDEVSGEKQSGQWFEEADRETALPTVLGGVSLLNFRQVYGDTFEQNYQVRERVERAISHTLDASEVETLPDGGQSSSVPEGSFFGGGTSDEVAHWRSQPFATSVSLELMTKYLLQYDDGATHEDRLVVHASPRSETLSDIAHPPLREFYIQDSLPPVDESTFEITLLPGLKSGNEGNEATLALSLSIGEHFRGSMQEATENIAMYDFELIAAGGLDLATGELDNYALSVGFHGISTTTNTVLQNDMAFFRTHYQKQYDVLMKSIFLWHGELSVPIIRLDSDSRINVDVAGSLLGMVHKSSDLGDTKIEVDSINFSDVDIGLTWVWSGLSASFAYGTSLGQATDSNGGHYFSLKNYRLSANVTYRPRSNHSLSFVAIRAVDGESKDLFDDDRIYLQYQYGWNLGP